MQGWFHKGPIHCNCVGDNLLTTLSLGWIGMDDTLTTLSLGLTILSLGPIGRALEGVLK